MASQDFPLEVDVRDLIPVVKDETTETPVCGCSGGIPAFVIKHLAKK